MDDCCVRSFVEKGFREHFRSGDPGETHRCPTCGQVFELVEAEAEDTPTRGYRHYEWKAVTH